MGLEDLIAEYGYLAVLVGTFFEGETVLVMGGFVARQGLLKLPLVMAAAFFGTLAGDQLYFFMGRRKGMAYLKKRPNLAAKAERTLRLLHTHQNWIILIFRFLIGLRLVIPFVIGASGISPVRFAVLNLIGACLWVLVVGLLGYLFGQTLEFLIGDLRKFGHIALLGIVLAGVLFWLVRFFISRRRKGPDMNERV